MSNPANPSKGLEGVVAADSRISDVKGDIGQLIYCGYDINELAGKVSYEEVVHLLHHGSLPNREELDELKAVLALKRELPKGVIDIIKTFPKEAPPMNAIRTAVSALGCFDPESENDSMDANRLKALRLIARIPIITAYFHRIRQGKSILPPDPSLGEAANFLYLIDGEKPSKEKESTIDMCYVLHADHGMNASTFSARVTIATLSDMYSAITSAIGTLKGPLHGGANEEAIKVLMEVGGPANAEPWVRRMFAEKRLVMGFGHRVYKKVDPRAEIVKRYCRGMAEARGDTSLEETAEIIERLLKTEKGLPANVDWPVARLYYYLGLEIELYTPLFVAARIAGWSAHVIEQHDHNRIFRPMGLYVGPSPRQVVPLAQRN
jgi:citrate synthase